MKTHLFFTGAAAVLGASLLTTNFAYSASEFLHFTRHRDSNGNLIAGPTLHKKPEPVIQKTMVPAQPRAFERRSTDWGMTSLEVKGNEPVKPAWELRAPLLEENERRVAYHTQIEGIDTSLTYKFFDDHLGQAKYVFESQHEDSADYIQDFHLVKDWITQTYGPATTVKDIWLDTLYQYDKSLWGQAVLRGHMVMVAEWQSPETQIVLLLDGGDDTIGLVADFTGTNYVVPVSYTENAMPEEMMEEASDMESIHLEDAPVQDSPMEEHSMGESQTDAEVASHAPANVMDVEKEIMKDNTMHEQTMEELPAEVDAAKDSMESPDTAHVLEMEEELTEMHMDENSIHEQDMDEHSVIEEHSTESEGNSSHL